MPNPHWENLKEVFDAAIALTPAERADYLNRVGDGDASLRQAVDSLIKSHEASANFVDRPAYQAAAEMLVSGVALAAGQTLGHYKIISPLGEGSPKVGPSINSVAMKRWPFVSAISEYWDGSEWTRTSPSRSFS